MSVLAPHLEFLRSFLTKSPEGEALAHITSELAETLTTLKRLALMNGVENPADFFSLLSETRAHAFRIIKDPTDISILEKKFTALGAEEPQDADAEPSSAFLSPTVQSAGVPGQKNYGQAA